MINFGDRGIQQYLSINRPAIKGLQIASGNIADTDSIVDITLSNEVNKDNCLIFGGAAIRPEVATFTNDAIRWTLINDTTVRLIRDGTTNASAQATLYILEFYPGSIKSKESITVTVDAVDTSVNKTINSIDTNKVFPIQTGFTSDNTLGNSEGITSNIEETFTSATNFNLSRDATASFDMVFGYDIIEIF